MLFFLTFHRTIRTGWLIAILIPPRYGLYKGCIGPYGVIFWEQLLGYPPKYQNFPFDIAGQGQPDICVRFLGILPIIVVNVASSASSRLIDAASRGRARRC